MSDKYHYGTYNIPFIQITLIVCSELMLGTWYMSGTILLTVNLLISLLDIYITHHWWTHISRKLYDILLSVV